METPKIRLIVSKEEINGMNTPIAEGQAGHEDMAQLVTTTERWLLVKGGDKHV